MAIDRYAGVCGRPRMRLHGLATKWSSRTSNGCLPACSRISGRAGSSYVRALPDGEGEFLERMAAIGWGEVRETRTPHNTRIVAVGGYGSSRQRAAAFQVHHADMARRLCHAPIHRKLSAAGSWGCSGWPPAESVRGRSSGVVSSACGSEPPYCRRGRGPAAGGAVSRTPWLGNGVGRMAVQRPDPGRPGRSGNQRCRAPSMSRQIRRNRFHGSPSEAILGDARLAHEMRMPSPTGLGDHTPPGYPGEGHLPLPGGRCGEWGVWNRARALLGGSMRAEFTYARTAWRPRTGQRAVRLKS